MSHPQQPGRRRALALLGAAPLLVAGCGFKLRGSAAFSASRLSRLTQTVKGALPGLKSLAAEHCYFVELKSPLAPTALGRLKDLLRAHPAGTAPAGTPRLLTPRPGTISHPSTTPRPSAISRPAGA